MNLNLRYPNITGASEKEQIARIKSYLHQLVDQLNVTLSSDSGSGSSQTYEVQGGEMSYYELRSLIIQELQEVENLFDQLSKKMEEGYVKKDDVESIAELAISMVSFTMDEFGNLYYEIGGNNNGEQSS